jgi:hypothetical protein
MGAAIFITLQLVRAGGGTNMQHLKMASLQYMHCVYMQYTVQCADSMKFGPKICVCVED